MHILGHRGGKDLWPENSLEGFAKALALGIEAIECDVHFSSDRQLMVIHDPTLDRTTEASGDVAAQTAGMLSQIRLRNSNETIPRLAELLELVADGTGLLYVEIKTNIFGARYSGIEEAVVSAVRDHGLEDRTTIVSFVPEILARARQLSKSIGLMAPVHRGPAQMLGGIPAVVERLNAIDGCAIAMLAREAELIWDYCENGIGLERLGLGSVNTPEQFDRWLPLPLRHIATDRPDLAVEARKRIARP